MKKLIVVINGGGGVGKDTLITSLTEKYKVANVSSVDPIKMIASQNGWSGEKDDKARLFLSELKRVFSEYNDLPTKYLVSKTCQFVSSDSEILFLHIREPEQIEHYKNEISSHGNICATLLVERADVHEGRAYENHSDDDVCNYQYDYVFENVSPVGESTQRFLQMIERAFVEYGAEYDITNQHT